MAGFGSCQTRRLLRGLGIAFCLASNRSLLTFAASGTFPGGLASTTRQHYYFCADRLSNHIQLRFADASALTYKDFRHRKLLPTSYGHMPKIIICHSEAACQFEY